MAKVITPVSRKYLNAKRKGEKDNSDQFLGMKNYKTVGDVFAGGVHNAVALGKNVGKVVKMQQEKDYAKNSKKVNDIVNSVKNAGGSLRPSGVSNNRGGIMGEFARWQDEWQKKNKKKK